MKHILTAYKPLIDTFLRTYLTRKAREIGTVNAFAKRAVTDIAKLADKGKAIRGSLVLFCADCFGTEISQDHLRAAAAIELLHTSILIHDDITDRDTFRRGLPTLSVLYADGLRKRKAQDGQFFGEQLAMYAGDLGYFFAFSLLADLDASPPVAKKVLQTISTTFAEVGAAQMQDVLFSLSRKLPSEEEIFSVYRYKTARYTFSLPLMIGALLGNQPEETIANLSAIGENLGIAYQLQDDTLALYGTSGETGKAVGNDICENKKTIYYHHLFDKTSPSQRMRLQRIIANHSKAAQDIAYIQKLIREYAIDKAVADRVSFYYEEAQRRIQTLPIAVPRRKQLFAFVLYLQKRRS